MNKQQEAAWARLEAILSPKPAAIATKPAIIIVTSKAGTNLVRASA